MVNGTDENGITAQIVDCGTGFAKDYEGKDVQIIGCSMFCIGTTRSKSK